MPITLPKRAGYPESFEEDTPLTNVGVLEARLTGEGMALKNKAIRYAFCSPALRCVQTCHGVLSGKLFRRFAHINQCFILLIRDTNLENGYKFVSGLGITNEVPIKIEPGLFEWVAWYADSYPSWMTYEELMDAGFNPDLDYKPLITKDALKERISESCTQYYQRCFDVIQHILRLTKELGKCSRV